MGATFSAVHVRGVTAKALVKSVTALVLDEGQYALLEDDAPEAETDRQVLIFDDGNGWGVVADADFELDLDAARDLARSLSKEHGADALLIAVHHSDSALLERFSKGRSRGSVSVPEDARLDKKSGHKQVEASFLKDLGATKEAKRVLSSPVLADRTFPEDTVLELAQQAGLGAGNAGARYLWNEPPRGARRLRFAPIALEAPAFMDWRPPGAEGQAMSLHHQPAVQTCVGASLGDVLHFTLQAHEGPRVEGLRVELSGTALSLLELSDARGWNPDLANAGPQHFIEEVAFIREGDRLVARFPKNFVEAQGVPTMADSSPAAFRQWSESLAGHHRRQFHFSLSGVAKAAGSGALRVKVTRLNGAALPVAEAELAVSLRPAPRLPLLPTGKVTPDEQRQLQAREQHAGHEWVVGWLAFDAPWSKLGGFMLQAASKLAAWVAGAGELELSVTSAGTHPTVRKTFRAGADMGHKDFAVAVRHLAQEAQVHLHAPYAAMLSGAPPSGYVVLSHQPHGSTIFDPEMRAQLDATHPRPAIPPLVLSFSLPAISRAQGVELEALVRSGAAEASCIGALVTPSAAAPHPGPLPWEMLTAEDQFVDDLERARNHVRAPGWLTLAPGKAAQRVEASARVTASKVASGVLLASTAPDPGSMTDDDRTAMERAVLPALPPRRGT